MAKNYKGLMKEIVEMKRENEELERLISLYKRDNFDYALKCSHMENILENIQSAVKTHPPKLIDSLNDMCKILEKGGTQKEITVLEDQTVSKSLLQKSVVKSTPQNKAHVVKPHMVNGHILYVPTINLTRVSNLNTQNDNSDESMVRISNNDDDETQLPTHDIEMREESESQEFYNENPLSAIEEVSEASTSSPSKSPSHSTVLSGTFQEVKIYLNRSSESLQEEPSTSKRRTKTRSTKSSSRRSTLSFDNITMRRKRS